MINQFTGIAGAGAAFALDQGTKALINANSAILAAGLPVFPGFNLVYLRNDGITFGLLGGAPWWALSALAFGVIVWFVILMTRASGHLDALAYGLVIGGALGNVADRLRFGAVTDFLDFTIAGRHWPVFNLSDVAVVSGVGLLLLSEFLASRKARKGAG